LSPRAFVSSRRIIAAPGALRAGFELHRAFDEDVAAHRALLAANGKLTLPVLAVGGQASTTGPLMAQMMREVAETVIEWRAPHSGHWIAEENPQALLERLLAFFAGV
jgi:pimeloyl-ACP methyl ester carboxylesterase